MAVSGEAEIKIRVFQWIINTDFFDGKETGNGILSPKFSSHNSNSKEKIWQLRLYPQGETTENKGYISLFLMRTTSDSEINVRMIFSILNQDNEKLKTKSTKYTFETGKNLAWGFGQFVENSFVHDPKNKIISDNKLTILCKVIEEKVVSENNSAFRDELNSHRMKEFDRFEKLFENEEFTDVTVETQGKCFHLHKCVLATGSKVFEAMLKNNMKEKNENKIEIKDIKYEVLQELFRYIYSGKVNDIKNIVVELLIAAEKYCIEGLKELCEKTMSQFLQYDNAVEYLSLAVTNNAKKLEADSIKYISLYLDHFIESDDFDLEDLDSESLVKIMKDYINNQN